MEGYYTKSRQVTSKLSGGRPHYVFRPRTIVTQSFVKPLEMGENPYTAALDYYDDDKLYYYISDVNLGRNPFNWEAGDNLLIPNIIVKESKDKPVIY